MKAVQGEDQVPDMVCWNMTKNLRWKVLIKSQAEVETYNQNLFCWKKMSSQKNPKQNKIKKRLFQKNNLQI